MVSNLDSEATARVDAQSRQLHASVRGAGPPLVLLHGLFGMGSNLGALGRSLADRFEVHQLDLPNHGRSPWMAAMTLTDMSQAVVGYLAREIGGPVLIGGHSLGGKVAMQVALENPEWVHALLMADIAPVQYPRSHDAVFKGIAAVAEQAPTSRANAIEQMAAFIEDPGVRQFLALSLYRDDAGYYRWRFNADGLREGYASLLLPPVGDAFRGPALMIYGALSTYVDELAKTAAKALFPNIEFVELADTGHWLHAEKPDEFNAAAGHFFDSAAMEAVAQ